MKPFDYAKYLKNNPLLKESFSNRISNKNKGAGMEESFSSRISATSSKSKELTEPALIKLFPIIKKECGNEYQASMQKSSKGEGRIFIMPYNTDGPFKGPIGAVVVAHPNGTVTIGSAKDSSNDDAFFSSSDQKKFNSLDVDNILEYIATILSKLRTSGMAEAKEKNSQLMKTVSDLYDKIMTTKPYKNKIDDYLVDEIIEDIIGKPLTTWDELNDKKLAKIVPFLQAVIKWIDSKKDFIGLDMGWDGKQLTSTDDTEDMDEAKKNKDGDETWFSDVNYFKKEHEGYKLKPTDMVSIGDIPAMTYAQAMKKFGGAMKEGLKKKVKEGYTLSGGGAGSGSQTMSWEPDNAYLQKFANLKVGDKVKYQTKPSYTHDYGETKIGVIFKINPISIVIDKEGDFSGRYKYDKKAFNYIKKIR
jgi:hypothetical protein